MKRFLISIPTSVHVYVEAEAKDDIDEDMVYSEVLHTYGKYIEIPADQLSEEFDILYEEEISS